MSNLARRGSNNGQLLIEDANILFLNFTGREGKYNAEGQKNFCCLLDDDLAERLRSDGWNIKTLKPREGDEEQHFQPYVQVSVSYGKGRPPQVVLITSRGRTTLTEDEVPLLDYADMAKVDLIINPYAWNVNGNSGIKAYLKSLYVTLQEDYLERKYADVPEIRGGAPVLELEAGSGDDDVIDAEAWEVEDEVPELEASDA